MSRALKELDPVHSRHHDVRENDIESRDAGVDQLQRLLAVAGLVHAETCLVKHALGEPADHRLVVDDEYVFRHLDPSDCSP